MNSRAPYGEEYAPLGMQQQSHNTAVPGGRDPSRDFMMQGAHFGSQQQAQWPQPHTQQYLPNGMQSGEGPPPGFHQMPPYMSHHQQRPPFPHGSPPHYLQQQHPQYGHAPPSPPPPYMHPPMHSNEFSPPPQPPPQAPPVWNGPPPVFRAPPHQQSAAENPTEKNKGSKTPKQKKKDSTKNASPGSYSYEIPPNVYQNSYQNANDGSSTPSRAIIKDEVKLCTELEHAKEAIAAMFPQLSVHIQSTLLRLLLEDIIVSKKKIEYKASDHSVVLEALRAISSQPQSSPSLCYKKLINLKECYLDGKPLQTARLQVVKFLGGGFYREYPWLAQKSTKEIASVAQELAMMLPAALKPLPLEPVLELRQRQPEHGWIQIDTTAINAAQSKVKDAKLVETPILLNNFAMTSAARELATASLQKLDTTSAIVSDGGGGGGSGSGSGLSELYLYGQTDFGVQTIINPTSDENSGTSVKDAALVATNPSDLLNAMLTTGSTTASKNRSKNKNNQTEAGVANALEFRHVTLERGVVCDQTNTTGENTSNLVDCKNSNSIFVLGGFTAPQLPSTFTTIDTARLFWSDRSASVIKLDPGQQHSLTIALCRLNSPERRGESGILQQAVVLFIAVAEKTEAYNEIARIQGASFVDVYSNYNASSSSNQGNTTSNSSIENSNKKQNKAKRKLIKNNALGMEEVDIDGEDRGHSGFTSNSAKEILNYKVKGTRPVATLGTPQSPTEQPLYRIFACARRVSVALLDSTQLTATTQLRVDAKPFIPPRWKRVFDTQPVTFYSRFADCTKQLLVVDAENECALVSAASKKVWATHTHLNNSGSNKSAFKQHKQQRGLADQVNERENSDEASENDADTTHLFHNYEFQNSVLQRYNRLLHLEELAKEQDICRHDVFNAQMHLAVFAHTNKRKFTEVHLTDGGGSTRNNNLKDDSAPKNKISKGMYRGPSITHIFPEPLFRKSEIIHGYNHNSNNDNGYDDVYVLGMLRHTGLSEGRPSLVIGDAVHVRPVARDDVECVCLVASIDGDIAYLVLPENFWKFTGLENLLQECAVQLPAGSTRTRSATVLEVGDLPKESTFNGRVHVRFSFDRRPFMHMQNALCVADQKSGGSTNMPTCLVPAVDSEILNNNSTESDIQGYLQPSVAQVEEVSSKIELVCGRSGAPLNTEQRHAVSALIAGAGRASPYALHGPPGTGKTVTMVSAALQLLSTYPEARLLLCAPQNYSADLLCSALSAAGLNKTQVLRLNDPRRPPYSAKEDTMDFTLFNTESGLFELPRSLEQLQSYSVVVSTCSAAAMLYPYYKTVATAASTSQEASKGGFTHVLIDESGQALLPEALIPLALQSPPKTIPTPHQSYTSSNSSSYESLGWGALLCGDPQQLGPTVHSVAASASGLSSSLLERLISAHWQSSHRLLQQGLVPATSMLLANYRSHASLLNLPSKLFYRGQLVAAADPSSVLPPQWKELSKNNADDEKKEDFIEEGEGEEYIDEHGYGYDGSGGAIEDENEYEISSSSTPSASLMFYGVRGQQVRESDIPSFHNPLEAAAVADLVQGLLDSVNAGVKLTDIGIMATYRRQVQSIRLLLRQRGLGQVRVGTVDDYQGQEERIVFISTVLTKPSSLPHHVSSDSQYLGVWNNPKRFNVAITRAKALLVVVGHPAVLIKDPSWKELLRHCASIGAFRGAGADALAERLGVDLLGGGPGELDFMNSVYRNSENNDVQEESGRGIHGGNTATTSIEMAKAIDQMASLALLGVGDAAQMFPETLEEAYASYADEMEWRIML